MTLISEQVLEFRFDPMQARDAHGRWTRFGGLGEAAKVISHSPEGFSVNLRSGGEPVHGYMVAQQGHTHTFPESVLGDRKALARAIDTMLMKEKAAFGLHTYLGGWVHDGKLWLEPSDNITDLDEAKREGTRRDQIAIWDVANSAEIDTGGHGGGSITEHANTQGDHLRATGLLGPARGRAPGGGRAPGWLDPGGLASQILNLGWHDAWMHELRGRHGEWAKTGEADPMAWHTGVQNINGRSILAFKFGWLDEHQFLDRAVNQYNAGNQAAGNTAMRSAIKAAERKGEPGKARADEYRRLLGIVTGRTPSPSHRTLPKPEPPKPDASTLRNRILAEAEAAERAGLPDEVSQNLVYAARVLERASADNSWRSVAAGYLRTAAKHAQLAGKDNRARHYEELAHEVQMADAATLQKGTAGEAATKSAAKAATIVPGLIGNGEIVGGVKESWDGKPLTLVSGEPYLAQFDWRGHINMDEGVARALNDISASDSPVNDPSAPAVLLHELIHGVIPEHSAYGSNANAYQKYGTSQIEEGFTELGTIHHMPAFLDKMGWGGKETQITAEGAPDNPEWAQAKSTVIRDLRDQAQEYLKSGYPGPTANADQLSQRIQSAIYDLLMNDDPESVRDVLPQMRHLGDPQMAKITKQAEDDLAKLDATPRTQRATMTEYATRLLDPTRISDGQAWGHYGPQTAAAQAWVQKVAMAEGHGDLRPGKEGYGRVVELADEVNRQGAAGKIPIMARQLIRATLAQQGESKRADDPLFMSTVAQTVIPLIEKSWEKGFTGGGPASEAFVSGQHAIKNALTFQKSMESQQFAGITAQVLDMGWHDAWLHEARGRHGEWEASPASFGGLLKKAARGIGEVYNVGQSDNARLPITDIPERETADVKAEAAKAVKIVPGLLGGNRDEWNGKVKAFNSAKTNHLLAELDWDGTMYVGDNVAAAISDAHDNPGKPVALPGAFEVLEHEMIHGVVPPESAAANKAAYQEFSVGQIEEGFTELGAIQHAPEFVDRMGVGNRESGEWAGHTVREQAEQIAHPDNIKAGHAWGHYETQTKDAEQWVEVIAQNEGHHDFTPGTPGYQRTVSLADEVNREGAAGKVAVMARQMAYSVTTNPALRNNADFMGRLMSSVESDIHQQWSVGQADQVTQQLRANAQSQVEQAERELAERGRLAA